jgi:YbgC/YbaW family acyl-CoA thioester hydrolase
MHVVSLASPMARLGFDEMTRGIAGLFGVRRGEKDNTQSLVFTRIGESEHDVDCFSSMTARLTLRKETPVRFGKALLDDLTATGGGGCRPYPSHAQCYARANVIAYERPIRFDEVDPAGIVFFARFMNYAHEAMENFFASLEGGYPALIQGRKVGLPTVRLEADFLVPLRYGESLRIETSCTHLGNTSATLMHEMRNATSRDLCAVVRHVVVTVTLGVLKPCAMPADVRAQFVAHQVPTSDRST